MYCENCGNKNDGSHKFCTKCGRPTVSDSAFSQTIKRNPVRSLDERWWHRLLKVVYIFLYIQILWIVPVVWSTNSTDYDYYGGQYHYTDTTGEAFWYSILAIVIFVVVLRLIKLTVLYITLAQKPIWRDEFKKLF